MSEKSNYRCVGSRWVDDFTNDCKHVVTGTYAVYNDSMYICKYNEWELASISDSKDSCTADNDSTTYKFNGYYYACENEAWRKFNEIEMELGYCRSSIYGKIDTIFYKGGSDDDEDEGDGLYTYKDYTCDSTGWRRSVMKDYIGDCDSSRMYEEAEFHKVGFVCRYDYWKDTTVWDPFTTLETEIGVCSPKKIGRIDSTETGVIYYCDSTDWRKADINDFLGECNAKREKEVGSWLKAKYKCVDSSWVALRGVEAEYGLCTPSRTGEIDTLDGYAYVCKDSTWNIAKPADIGGVCDKSKEYKEIDVGSDRYYCEDSSWIQMTSIEKMHGLCRGAKIGKRVSYSTDNYYCDSKSGWRKMTALENRFGVCTDSLEGVTKMYSDSGYQCVSGTWSRMSKIEYLGTCDSTAYGKSVSYNGTVYVCRYTDWSVATAVDKRLGMCSYKIWGSVAKDTTSGNYFTCYSNGWVKTDAEVGALGRCNSDTKIVKELSDGRVYYCQGKFWTEAKTVSALYGTCTAAMKLKKVEFKDTTYICDSTTYGSSWHALTGLDTVRYCGAGNVDDTLTYEREHYVCTKVSGTSKTSYEWRIVSIVKYLGSCTVVNDGEEIYNGLNYSACIDEEWVGQLKKNFTDTRDSKKYKVQEIDGSTWMAQNMNYAQADSSICVDDDEDTNCGESGRLYSFTEAETVCPTGWHLPDSTEWKSMVDYLNDLAHVNLLWGSYDDIYGLKISPTGYVLYYLQNGQDPMTVRENDDTGAYFWMPNGDVYYFGKKYTVYGTSEGLQRQSSRVLKAAVRCVMD